MRLEHSIEFRGQASGERLGAMFVILEQIVQCRHPATPLIVALVYATTLSEEPLQGCVRKLGRWRPGLEASLDGVRCIYVEITHRSRTASAPTISSISPTKASVGSTNRYRFGVIRAR